MPFPDTGQLRETNMRKPLLLIVPAVLLVGFSAVRVPTTYAQAPSTDRAKKIYQVDCAMCHGDTGDGKTDLAKDMGVTSNFTDPKSLEGKTDQQLFDVIRKGKDKMPGEEDNRAKDAEIKALIKYIRDFSKNAPTPAAQPAPAATPAPTSPTAN
jgi:mono/diheme cytochrome c family protein